jgi:hypothetical protein
MTLTISVWLVILGALLLANLPFVLDRPLAPWPWAQALQAWGDGSRWAFGLGFLVLLAAWSWGTLHLVGSSFGGVGDGLFIFKLLICIGLAAALLSAAGWLAALRQPAASDTATRKTTSVGSGKLFIDRFLELLVGYVLVGMLGFAMELDLGNAFPQGWEFYAVTLALFIVLGYPGFVWCYMLQRRRHH